MRSYGVDELGHVGSRYAPRLAAVGIRTTRRLLRHCATREGRRHLCRELRVSEVVVLRWAHLADLMRVPGVGSQFSELLAAAGVATVADLAANSAEDLVHRLARVNRDRRLAGVAPAPIHVERWIAAARRLDRVVEP